MAGDFPDSWQMTQIEDCMEAIIDYRGKTPRKTNYGIPLITAKIVKGGRIESPNEFVDPTDYDVWMRRGLPKKGDVVVTTEAPLGEVAQIDDPKVALAQRLIALRGRSGKLDNTFLKFLMQSVFIQSQLLARASGTTVSGIKQSELRKIYLPLPPIKEQQAIACILGALDDKIELNRRMNRTLEETARAIFKSWFVDFDPVRAKAAGTKPIGLNPEIAALFPDSFEDSELGEIPRGWRVQSFTDGIDVMGGGTPKTSNPEYWGGNIPWFSVVDTPAPGEVFVIGTDKKITEQGVNNSSTRVLPVGTTIISARGTVGNLALVGVPMAMNQSCYGLCDRRGLHGYFLYYLTEAVVETLRQRTHGSVFNTITRDTLNGVLVVAPPDLLVNAFEHVTGGMLQRILSALCESRTLATLRDTMLPKLISGELRVLDAERLAARCV